MLRSKPNKLNYNHTVDFIKKSIKSPWKCSTNLLMHSKYRKKWKSSNSVSINRSLRFLSNLSIAFSSSLGDKPHSIFPSDATVLTECSFIKRTVVPIWKIFDAVAGEMNAGTESNLMSKTGPFSKSSALKIKNSPKGSTKSPWVVHEKIIFQRGSAHWVKKSPASVFKAPWGGEFSKTS